MVASATTQTYTIMLAGKPCTFDHLQLRQIASSRAGLAFDAERSMLAYYVQLGVLLLEIRRVIGSTKSYIAFLRGADINLKKASRAVRFAAELGTELGNINRVRLFELLHAYDPARWKSIDDLDGGLPGIRATEAALRGEPAPKLSTPARTHVSAESKISTGSGDEYEEDEESDGDEFDDDVDGLHDVELDPNGPTLEQVLATAPSVSFDDDDVGGRTSSNLVEGLAPSWCNGSTPPFLTSDDETSRPQAGCPALMDGSGPVAQSGRAALGALASSEGVTSRTKVGGSNPSGIIGTRSTVSRGVGGDGGTSSPSVQLTLDSVYEETSRRLDAVTRRLAARDLSAEQCERLNRFLDELE